MTIKIHEKMPHPLLDPRQGPGDVQPKGSRPSPPGRKDSIDLTEQARRFEAIERSLLEQPEVDETRITALKEAIDSGTYRIDTRRLAENILKTETLLFGERRG